MNLIQFYATKTCSDCHRSLRVFEKHKIKFNYVDIGEVADAAEYVMHINNGRRTVPTIVFPDGSILVEPSDPDLENKLNQIGLI